MPYKSQAQFRLLHAKHPEIAARWDKEGFGYPKAKKKKPRLRKRPRRKTG